MNCATGFSTVILELVMLAFVSFPVGIVTLAFVIFPVVSLVGGGVVVSFTGG